MSLAPSTRQIAQRKMPQNDYNGQLLSQSLVALNIFSHNEWLCGSLHVSQSILVQLQKFSLECLLQHGDSKQCQTHFRACIVLEAVWALLLQITAASLGIRDWTEGQTVLQKWSKMTIFTASGWDIHIPWFTDKRLKLKKPLTWCACCRNNHAGEGWTLLLCISKSIWHSRSDTYKVIGRLCTLNFSDRNQTAQIAV